MSGIKPVPKHIDMCQGYPNKNISHNISDPPPVNNDIRLMLKR